jgi:hypothetical protein
MAFVMRAARRQEKRRGLEVVAGCRVPTASGGRRTGPANEARTRRERPCLRSPRAIKEASHA